MKVFISWSGEQSLKVAQAFRNWLPIVIQSLEPYVSAEDIDKGTRWSTDIATELEYSTFGILCVTKENLDAPWLSFEAGALSKTMDKSAVCPFLFNIKRSEVSGPILQFQSTIFSKDDIKKLVISLNKSCGEESIKEDVLNKTFEYSYPSLEDELNGIKNLASSTNKEKEANKPNPSEILEEILDLSRNNQKLLRNPDTPKLQNRIDTLIEMFEGQMNRNREFGFLTRRNSYKYTPMFMEELLHQGGRIKDLKYNAILALSIFKEDFPWIYEAGKETLSIFDSKRAMSSKHEALMNFQHTIEMTANGRFMEKRYEMSKYNIDIRESLHMLQKYFDYLFEGKAKNTYK